MIIIMIIINNNNNNNNNNNTWASFKEMYFIDYIPSTDTLILTPLNQPVNNTTTMRTH